MAAMTVLAVGLDLGLTAKRAWEKRGLFVTTVQTPGEAVSVLRSGDFDVCVVGNSVSNESRAKLVAAFRFLLRSSIPVISITDQFRSPAELQDVFDPHGAGRFVGPMMELLSDARQNAAISARWARVTEPQPRRRAEWSQPLRPSVW